MEVFEHSIILFYQCFRKCKSSVIGPIWEEFNCSSINELLLTPDNSKPSLTRTSRQLNQNRLFEIVIHLHSNFTLGNSTLGNSNLPLTQRNFCFPSDHFYIILPSITRTMFWALKKSGKNSVLASEADWILNSPLTCCRHWPLLVTSKVKQFYFSKMHALFRQRFVTLRSDF